MLQASIKRGEGVQREVMGYNRVLPPPPPPPRLSLAGTLSPKESYCPSCCYTYPRILYQCKQIETPSPMFNSCRVSRRRPLSSIKLKVLCGCSAPPPRRMPVTSACIGRLCLRPLGCPSGPCNWDHGRGLLSPSSLLSEPPPPPCLSHSSLPGPLLITKPIP